MKLSTLFWGVLFLVVGGLILLNNLGLLDVNWVSIWRLWPLILILWGLSLIVGRERPKWYVVVLMVLLMLFMITAVLVSDWFDRDYDYVFREASHQTFVEPYGVGIERASFALSSGAGKFSLRDTTAQLLEASTDVSFGGYTLERERSEDSESLTLSYKGRSRHWNFGRYRNRAEVRLNASPAWDIDIDAGASSVDFDLSPYKVDRMEINAGASSLKIRLGDRSDETRLRIQAGVSSIDIEVPEAVGCELRAHGGLSSKRISGFESFGGGTYQTSDFDAAKKRIYLEIDAAVSRIRVSRY
jgi:hypothetical protein